MIQFTNTGAGAGTGTTAQGISTASYSQSNSQTLLVLVHHTRNHQSQAQGTSYNLTRTRQLVAHQYDLFKVSDGTNTYYGNLISANLEDDVTEIKLLRRFKDGL